MPSIYRAVSGASPGDIKYPRPNSRRIPKHIPYVVDNFWEWARPEGYANRRQCAYGSQSAANARQFGSGEIYRLEFLGDHQVCQLKGYGDAKYHPDVQGVKKAVFELLGGYDWSNQSLEAKTVAGRLYIPGLSAEEVDQILEEGGIDEEKKVSLRKNISFWNDVDLVGDLENFPDPEGEIFFTYPGGYKLRPL